jgi:hypothetical protein
VGAALAEPKYFTPQKSRTASPHPAKPQGKDPPASENENLTQYNTPTKRSRIGPQSHPAEDHRKDSQNKKRARTPTDNQEPIRDKLFTAITNKVIIMMKIKGARAQDELAGPNKGKIGLLSRADEKKIQKRQAQWIKTQGRTSCHHTRNDN